MESATVNLLAAVGGGGGVLAFARWAMRQWIRVRREAIDAAKRNADLAHEDNARMTQALVDQAASNADLAAKIDHLADKLDRLSDLERFTERLLAALGRSTRSGPIAVPDDDTEHPSQRTPTGVPRTNRRDRG